MMGWSDCGTDNEGRPIGYGFLATCDHEGCNEEIDRGLAYACGEMHGTNEHDCDKYFCEKHRANIVYDKPNEQYLGLCNECYNRFEDKDVEEEDE